MKVNSKPINYLEEYHRQSKDISLKFDRYIANEFANREDADLLKLLYKKFLDAKIGHSKHRVMFVYIAAKFFDVQGPDDLSHLLPIMAVPELKIWSNYALNWITDEKNNLTGTKFEENIDLIASQYLLTEIFNFLPDRMLKNFLKLHRREMRGYLSVEMDLTITNFERLDDEKDFWKAYSRNHGIADVGLLYAYCFEIVQEYFELSIPPTLMHRVSKIMHEFGRTLQINGDLSDLIIPNDRISTTEKRPLKDYFIDIRTDRLTYPTWLIMKSAKQDNRDLYQELINTAKERRYKEGFYERVHQYAKKHGIIEEVLNFTRKEEKRLVREISLLGVDNEGASLWKSAMRIISGNKFAKQIKIDYDIHK